MSTVHVAASRSYEVRIAPGLLQDCGAAIREATGCRSAVVVSDSNVAPLYGERVLESLRAAGCEATLQTIPAGEASKCAGEYLRLLDTLSAVPLTRADAVVALGGGVVGDLAGFAAATYLRGIALVQLPTSLLAMVDSSVGGKTAIDLPAGKNLCGAFHQPSLVLCDTDTLATLPEEIFRDGCAEVIKYGALCDPEILQLVKDGARTQLQTLIERCVAIKRDLVQRDERDTGARQLLNLGHTVGHAIEAESGFALSHGQAVAAGMVIVTRAAEAAGDCERGTAAALCEVLEPLGLPCGTDFPPEALLRRMQADKKRQADTITLVIPERIGACRLKKLPLGQLGAYLEAGFAG